MTDAQTASGDVAAPSQGRYVNTGNGPKLEVLDIEHDDYMAVVEADTAFWSLVGKDDLADTLCGGELTEAIKEKQDSFKKEMQMLRFGLKPSAVYFNPTEKCNLNCSYCYIPEEMRANGEHMTQENLIGALGKLREYFNATLPKEAEPQIIFHGAEPMLNREAMFAGIDEFKNDFRFGVQTNSVLLDDSAVEFLTDRRVSIGISLDAHTKEISDKTRKNWDGQGIYDDVLAAMERLKGYDGWSVICTVSSENMSQLTNLVDFFHGHEVPTCMMNILRCTLPPSRDVKPDDVTAAQHFIKALDRTYELFQETGRKMPVANFANILLSIIAPTARRLMCDISPCGGGRCFFALAPNGDMFPCSEFIGLEKFNGGNLFKDKIDDVLKTEAFTLVSERVVEDIDPCNKCAIRHFCGSPCPAEAHEMNGGMHRTGAFCEFYEEQVRYAFRLIADQKEDAFLWDGWDDDSIDTFNIGAL